MKSIIFNFSLVLIFCTNAFCQPSPEGSDPSHTFTHIKQSNNYFYSNEEGTPISFGCLDPSQPFSIEFFFQENSFNDNIRFVIQDENGIRLYETRLHEDDAEHEGSTTSFNLDVSSIENLNCANYGSSVTLTFTTEQTLWTSGDFHPHSFDATIEICCKKGTNILNNTHPSYFAQLGQPNLELFPNNQKNNEQFQDFKIGLYDLNGNEYMYGETQDLSRIPLPYINRVGIYFLVITQENSSDRSIVKINFIE